MSKVIIKYVNQGHCNSFAKPGRKGLLSKGSSQEKRGPLVANNTQDLHSATIEPLNAFLMAEELAASCRLFQNESKQSHQTYFLADIPNTNTLGLRNFSLYLEIEFRPSYRLTKMEILSLTR